MILKHRWTQDQWYSTLSKVSHCPCAPTLMQPMPSVHIVPSRWGQLWETSSVFSTPRECSSWHIIWHHPANSWSNTLKAVSDPKIRALQACCKFDNHVTEKNHRWLDDVIARGLPFHRVDVAPLRKSTNLTFEYDWRRLVATRMYSCAILVLLPVGEFFSSTCSIPFWMAAP